MNPVGSLSHSTHSAPLYFVRRLYFAPLSFGFKLHLTTYYLLSSTRVVGDASKHEPCPNIHTSLSYSTNLSIHLSLRSSSSCTSQCTSSLRPLHACTFSNPQHLYSTCFHKHTHDHKPPRFVLIAKCDQCIFQRTVHHLLKQVVILP